MHVLLTLCLLLMAALPAPARASESIQPPIDSPAEAHAAVIASGAPFGDFVLLSNAMIGASQYYEVKGEPASSAAWIVVYTYGWGDCQAGCISRHTFAYLVDPVNGAVAFNSQQGDALPADAPEVLKMLEALNGAAGGVVPIAVPQDTEVTPGPSSVPGSEDPDWAAMYEQWYQEFVAGLEPCAPDVDPTDPTLVTCLLPDGSVAGPIPLFAPALGPDGETGGGDGWVNELPQIILAAMLLWIGGAALVGWRKSGAKS